MGVQIAEIPRWVMNGWKTGANLIGCFMLAVSESMLYLLFNTDCLP